jgi:hypothetical protein
MEPNAKIKGVFIFQKKTDKKLESKPFFYGANNQ